MINDYKIEEFIVTYTEYEYKNVLFRAMTIFVLKFTIQRYKYLIDPSKNTFRF